ncbi:MAG: TraB/GumN family protein, partial [Phycisphaerae bacterium]
MKKESEAAVRQPFLWRIVKADPAGEPQTPTSWIFGTIHVPDEEVTTLHPLVQSAFDDANAAYFEIDFIKNTGAQTKAISLPDGESLDELISAELIDRLDQRLKKLSPMFVRGQVPDVQVGIWPLLLGNLQAQARHPGRMPLDMRLY